MAGEEENTDHVALENANNNAEDAAELEPKIDEGEATQDQSSVESSERLIKLPMSRVKSIMKSDPDVTLASMEAVVALSKATEMFIYNFAKDAVNSTIQSKRKTLQRKDLDTILDSKDAYIFLEGALDEQL